MTEDLNQVHAHSSIEKKIQVRIGEGKKVYVIYCADEDENEQEIDNLDEIAVKGKAMFYHEADDFWGGEKSKDYISKVLENPTWLDLTVEANRMIKRTRDLHHVFFEGIELEKSLKARDTFEVPFGVPLYRFCMGS